MYKASGVPAFKNPFKSTIYVVFSRFSILLCKQNRQLPAFAACLFLGWRHARIRA
jgi:hypothetical protein